METSRRDFTKMTGALVAGAAVPVAATRAVQTGAAPRPRAYPPNAWHQRMKRIVHVNFNERDPEHFDVEAWANYLAGCHAADDLFERHQRRRFLPDQPA